MRVKVGHKVFDIVPIQDDVIESLCEDGNADMKIKLDGDLLCIRFGVDKMWVVSRRRGAYLVKPKTYSIKEIEHIVQAVSEALTTNS